MRSIFICAVLCGVLAGCATGRSSLDIPEGEATYEQPLEEVWPAVRAWFTQNQLTFREDPGSFVLETEWREEFAASRVAGFWHRYMVLGKRVTPTTSTLWIIRATRSANGALQSEGSRLDWSMGDKANLSSASSTADTITTDNMTTVAPPAFGPERDQIFDGNNGIEAKSQQGSRDLVMEWRVFDAIAPVLAEEAKAARDRQEAREAQLAEALAKRQAATPAATVECGLRIIGLEKQAKPGKVMLMGELHGTQEVPRFIAQSACQAAQAGVPVTVGLELPVESQERIARFIASEGTEEDWRKLMEAGFWRSPYPDGRSSEAMANLLEQLRGLRAQGMDVNAFVFDHPNLKGQEREIAMAKTVFSHVTKGPKRFYMTVSGNVHPRTRKGLPWDRDYRPMGLLLSQNLDDDDVIALDMAYDSGSAWICAEDPRVAESRLHCGVRRATGRDNGDRAFIHLFGGRTRDGFHGVFYVGKVTASVPAVNRGLGRPSDSGS